MGSLALDIGGSKIAYVITQDNVEKEGAITLVSDASAFWLIEKLVQEIEESISDLETVKSIGISSAPNIDGRGIVVAWPNRPEWKGFDVIKPLSRLCQNISWCDDGVASAIADSILRNNNENSLHLCVGTGFGGGLIYNGKLFGDSELGHQVVQAQGRRCVCGNDGCIQAYVSVRAYETFLTECNGGDAERVTEEWMRSAVKYMSMYLYNICCFFNVELVTISGGFTGLFPSFIDQVSVFLKNHYLNGGEPTFRIVNSPFGSRAPLQGAKNIIEESVKAFFGNDIRGIK